MLLTGDCERYSRVSGTRAGGVALIGDGREFKLGLSGALPLGAWLKTTTHCPTWKARLVLSSDRSFNYRTCYHEHLGYARRFADT